MKQTLIDRTSLVVISITILVSLSPTLRAQQPGEAAYTYVNNHPDEEVPGWNEDGQGLAHDRNNWFITHQHYIWKIPVTNNLAADAVDGVMGVIKKNITAYPELAGFTHKGDPHFGDPELFHFNGEDYLFVPIVTYDFCLPPYPGCDRPEGIAVFKGADLSYVAHTNLPAGVSGESWCALDPEGNLYVPNTVTNSGDPLTLTKFSCNFSALQRVTPALELTDPGIVELRDEAGVPVDLNKDYHQGGVISPSGELLYVVNGGKELYPDEYSKMGIHVFKLSTISGVTKGTRINRSTNGSGRFNFAFSWSFPVYQEPEGITFWDLDDGRAPGIQGQLHVMMVENDAGDDDVYVKHYTSAIYVDADSPWGWLFEAGTRVFPFDTVAEANNLAWDGSDIRITTGSYPEALTFSKTMRIIADGGPVTIGR